MMATIHGLHVCSRWCNKMTVDTPVTAELRDPLRYLDCVTKCRTDKAEAWNKENWLMN